VAADKIALLRAYGAEVIVCPTSVAPDHPESYYSVSDRLVTEIPGAWKPDQYHNPDNPRAQYESAGPEVWEQTRGRVTHFVAGVGTGGTISGIGHYLKDQNPEIQVIGADPEGSVYSGGAGRPYLVEGIGEDFWPTTYDPSVVDRVIAISEQRELRPRSSCHARGRAPPGRVRRHRGRRRADRRTRTGRPRGDRRAHPGLRSRVPVEVVQRRLDGRPRLPSRRGPDHRRPAGRA